MSPSSLCLSSKWLWRAVGTSKLSRQRGQINPSCGEFPFSPFSYVRVGESVTDLAFSAMFFRKFIFFGETKSAARHPWVWLWGSAPLSFPLSPQNDSSRGSSGSRRQVGFGSAGLTSSSQCRATAAGGKNLRPSESGNMGKQIWTSFLS